MTSPDPTPPPSTPATIAYEQPALEVHPTALAIGIVGLKLMGVWMLVSTLTSMPAIVSFFFQMNEFSTAGILAIACPLVAGTTLLLAASPIARFIFGRRTDAPLPMTAGIWMTVIVAGVGLLIAVSNLTEAVRAGVTFVQFIEANIRSAVPNQVTFFELFQHVSPMLQVAIGLVLFLRPRLLVGWWMKSAKL